MFHILSYLYGSTCQEIMYNSTNANPTCITVRHTLYDEQKKEIAPQIRQIQIEIKC